LLARKDLEASAAPSEFIGAVVEWAEAEGKHVKILGYHIRVPSAVQRLIELQIPDTLSSADRCGRVLEGILKTRAIHTLTEIARGQDNLEHYYSKADQATKSRMPKALDRAHVDQINDEVGKRVEDAVNEDRVTPIRDWVGTLNWYVQYLPDAARRTKSSLFEYVGCVATLLHVVVPSEAVELGDDHTGHFAQYALSVVATRFGIEDFDTALIKHEKEIRQMGGETTGRLEMYRGMKANFPQFIIPIEKRRFESDASVVK
jgi:hypothetical protein